LRAEASYLASAVKYNPIRKADTKDIFNPGEGEVDAFCISTMKQ